MVWIAPDTVDLARKITKSRKLRIDRGFIAAVNHAPATHITGVAVPVTLDLQWHAFHQRNESDRGRHHCGFMFRSFTQHPPTVFLEGFPERIGDVRVVLLATDFLAVRTAQTDNVVRRNAALLGVKARELGRIVGELVVNDDRRCGERLLGPHDKREGKQQEQEAKSPISH